MYSSSYTSNITKILDNGQVQVKTVEQLITPLPIQGNKLGVMMVGLGGNNGSTFAAGLLAHSESITWRNKNGEHSVQFLGSISQMGSVHIGYDSQGKPYSRLFKDITPMYSPSDIVLGGWGYMQR